MWRFEVTFINEYGFFQGKGFGYADKFEKYLQRLCKKGLKILSISDWDAEGIGARLKAEYLG